MAASAHNFAYTQTQAWLRCSAHAESNACTRASNMGGKRIHSVAGVDFWIHTEDDVKFSLWRWPDGSEYLIADDGSVIRPAYRRGPKHGATWRAG